MAKGSSGIGGSSANAGGGSQPKTQRDMQIDHLERNTWRGLARA